MDRRKVLARITAAMENGFSATRIGYIASGDPLFVSKLKAGHAFRPSTLWRAFEAIEEFDRPRFAWMAQGRRKPRPAPRGEPKAADHG
jgi:hypothetical protein